MHSSIPGGPPMRKRVGGPRPRLLALACLVSAWFFSSWNPLCEGQPPPIRILLSFDDGPANPTIFGSPTGRVLDVLQEEGIAAVFFVLTTPDRFLFRRIPKAETQAGFALLKREIAEGHVVGVHWGGDYESQWRRHPGRVLQAAYDSTGDGVCDKVTADGSALESDLLQAMSRIEQAAREVRVDFKPRYVRPPFLSFCSRKADVRPTYAALGLKMILTDGRYRDAGYAISPFLTTIVLRRAINRALERGETDIILSLHDSNHWTALRLRGVIRSVRSHFARKGMVEGTHWTFPKSRAAVENMLDARRSLESSGR